jgi:N utilization substance protein A
VPDAEALILNARVAAGWIEAPVVEEVEEEAYEDAEIEAEGGEADADATTEQ